MRTGRTVTELGLYCTECCSEEKVFDVGDTFSRCPLCEHLCEWEEEEEIVPCEALERPNEVAALV